MFRSVPPEAFVVAAAAVLYCICTYCMIDPRTPPPQIGWFMLTLKGARCLKITTLFLYRNYYSRMSVVVKTFAIMALLQELRSIIAEEPIKEVEDCKIEYSMCGAQDWVFIFNIDFSKAPNPILPPLTCNVVLL